MAVQDIKKCFNKNVHKVNFDDSLLSIDLDNVSNVRIIKKRNFFLNYFIIISTLTIYFLINYLFLLQDLIQNILRLVTSSIICSSFFVSKYSYEILINFVGLNFRKIKLTKSEFDKLSYLS
ncbi:hypothetical protein C3L50_02640 [Flavobacterium alvei]|uniref:Uncharacterized protein n=1 Tax=Flavobacterium alvei TaxID=2080416 RepID=A0A2S5AH39_9FLAO|nr:hypothetical protein C3L50_02640 [Flavobacterium alvei]